MKEKSFEFSFNCVMCPNEDCSLEELDSLIDRMRIVSVATFKRALGERLISQIRDQYGYSKFQRDPLTLERDYHVRFYSVRHRGKPAYEMVHSAIEHVNR